MSKRLILTLLTLLLAFFVHAETKENRQTNRHEIRFGVGDAFLGQFGITGRWYDVPYPTPPPPYEGSTVEEMHEMLSHDNVYYGTEHVLPHFFLGYQYRFNSWFGFGFQFDCTGIACKATVMNGYGENSREVRVPTFQMALIPEARFTYFHREKVNLFSTVGLGAAFQADRYSDGSVDYEWSPALQGTLLGVSVGSNHWFGTFELGYLFEPVLGVLAHKMLSASIGYRL